jgi:hypothetical protein
MFTVQGNLTIVGQEVFWKGVRLAPSSYIVRRTNGKYSVSLSFLEKPACWDEMKTAGIKLKKVKS